MTERARRQRVAVVTVIETRAIEVGEGHVQSERYEMIRVSVAGAAVFVDLVVVIGIRREEEGRDRIGEVHGVTRRDVKLHDYLG